MRSNKCNKYLINKVNGVYKKEDMEPIFFIIDLHTAMQ